MKSGKLWENVMGHRAYKLRVFNWGNLARHVHSDSSGHPLTSEERVLLSFRYREDISYVRVYDSPQGKVGEPSLYLLYFKFSQLQILVMPRCRILGLCVLNPINAISLSC